MKSNSNNHHLNKGGLWIALIFLFVISAKAQTSYPINDPRNPDCPCHKYQKLAEEEFKKLLEGGNTTQVKEKEIGISEEKKEKKKKVNDVKDKEVGVSNEANVNINKINGDNRIVLRDDGKSENKMMVPNSGDNVVGKISPEEVELNINELKMNRAGSVSRAPQYTTTKHWKGKRKKHTSFHKQMKRIFYAGGWDIWKGKRVTSACYHWK